MSLRYCLLMFCFYTCPATFALSMAALLWYISTLINRMNQPQLASGSRKLMAGFLLLFLIITTAGRHPLS